MESRSDKGEINPRFSWGSRQGTSHQQLFFCHYYRALFCCCFTGEYSISLYSNTEQQQNRLDLIITLQWLWYLIVTAIYLEPLSLQTFWMEKTSKNGEPCRQAAAKNPQRRCCVLCFFIKPHQMDKRCKILKEINLPLQAKIK